MPVSSAKTIYTVERAANKAGVTQHTLRNWIAAGVQEAAPTWYINGEHPCYSGDQLKELQKFAAERRANRYKRKAEAKAQLDS